MNCQTATRWMVDVRLGEAPLGVVAEHQGHLGACAACRREWEGLEELSEVLAEVPIWDPPASVWAGVEAQLTSVPAAPRAVPLHPIHPPWFLVPAAAVLVGGVRGYDRGSGLGGGAVHGLRPAPAAIEPAPAVAEGILGEIRTGRRVPAFSGVEEGGRLEGGGPKLRVWGDVRAAGHRALGMGMGKALVYVRPAEGPPAQQPWVLRGPGFHVVVRGTCFGVEVTRTVRRVVVWKGRVEVVSGAGQCKVEAGMQAVMAWAGSAPESRPAGEVDLAGWFRPSDAPQPTITLRSPRSEALRTDRALPLIIEVGATGPGLRLPPPGDEAAYYLLTVGEPGGRSYTVPLDGAVLSGPAGEVLRIDDAETTVPLSGMGPVLSTPGSYRLRVSLGCYDAGDQGYWQGFVESPEVLVEAPPK